MQWAACRFLVLVSGTLVYGKGDEETVEKEGDDVSLPARSSCLISARHLCLWAEQLRSHSILKAPSKPRVASRAASVCWQLLAVHSCTAALLMTSAAWLLAAHAGTLLQRSRPSADLTLALRAGEGSCA